MPVKLSYQKCQLTAALCGEIDHHNAAFLREEIDQSIAKIQPQKLSLDFSAVTFMDSSAVGLVMGRFRLMNQSGGAVEAVGLSSTAYRMMQLAGLERLAQLSVKPPKPSISVKQEGCV